MTEKKTHDLGPREWHISVPIFRSGVILRQLALAVGLPFGTLVVFLLFLAGKSSDQGAYYALALIGGLFLLTFLLIMAVYGGKYAAAFLVDDKGILCRTQKSQVKANLIINGLAMLLGLLARVPAAAGTGLLAQSWQSVFLRWSDIRKVTYLPQQHVILVRGRLTESIAIFCTGDNYGEIAAIVAGRCPGK